MRIKLAILEDDVSYMNRMVTVFNTKYAKELEIYSFSDMDVAIENITTNRIDVLLASNSFEVDIAKLPKKCGFAYLVSNSDIERIGELPAVFKFQRADLIYQAIINVYSEKAENVTGKKKQDGHSKLIIFASPCGGCGTTSVAIGCAMSLAKKGKKTLFLSYQNYDQVENYLYGEGQYGMSDIIYALKSKKTNLMLKIEGSVKQDISGTYFLSSTKSAMDMLELSVDERMELLKTVCTSGIYEYVVLDMRFSFDKKIRDFFTFADDVVIVGDGTVSSNGKITRMLEALAIVDQSSDDTIFSRLSLIYNKFGSVTGKMLPDSMISVLGGVPVFKGAANQTRELVNKLSEMAIYDGLL